MVRPEIDKEKKRAQSFFDYLAHDIANMTSPILSYSEAILDDPNIDEDTRAYARKILMQAEKISGFISNFRLYAEAEKISPQASERFDLKDFLRTTESIISCKMEGKCKFEIEYSQDGPMLTFGGGFVDRAIMYHLNHGSKFKEGMNDKLAIRTCDHCEPDGRGYWDIVITCHYPFVPQMEASFAHPFHPSKRGERPITSDPTFASAIIEYFGGHLKAEAIDRNDHAKGFMITISLLKAK